MSWVQFNLLPDSKLEYKRAEHTKKLVFTSAFIASATSLAILLIMLGFVDGIQKKLMNDAAARVDKASSQLQSLKIDKIITVQSQLKALPGLHQNKHITSRIYTYLPKITPPDVSINKLDMDLTQNTMVLSGTAGSQQSINTFIDTLKFATYTLGSGSVKAPAFQSVVESGFNINPGSVGYTISMNFDPKLFANNLTDSQGKPVTPQISVDTSSFNSPLKSPSTTLFNSSQTSTGAKQ